MKAELLSNEGEGSAFAYNNANESKVDKIHKKKGENL